jgi:3-oxoacyl-[acyl-carrier protein] reductase
MRGAALITGSAKGIGRVIAERLASDGWKPLLHYRASRNEAEALAQSIGGIACPFGADIADASQCEKLWDWAVGEGPVVALVNNAGLYSPLDFCGASVEEFESSVRLHFETNFFGPMRLIRSFVRQGIEGSRILNVSSRVGFKGEGGAALYAASKAALTNLTRSLAVELAPKGISVFGIAPGWVETAMVRADMDARQAEILAGIPLGRMASPADCAATAAFLLRDEAAYLSGQVIDINGASYFH